MAEFARRLAEYQATVDGAIADGLARAAGVPAALAPALQYALFPGGKRLRPVLALAACEAVAGAPEPAIVPAAAVELVHCASLVHDDMPCMDDDDVRRGRPAMHVAYGEATALLAGSALYSMACEWIAAAACEASQSGQERLLQCVAIASKAMGPEGMMGGQALDLAATGRDLEEKDLDRVNALKTGALIVAAVQMGAVCGGASSEDYAALMDYGRQLGRAFQLCDDLLDADKDSRATVGNPGYVAVVGLERTRYLADEATELARRSIAPLGRRGWFLERLLDEMRQRTS